MKSRKLNFDLTTESIALDFSPLFLNDHDEIWSIDKDPMTGDYVLLISGASYHEEQRLVIWNPETKKQICKRVKDIASENLKEMVVQKLSYLSTGLIWASCNNNPSMWGGDTHFSMFFNDTLHSVADKLIGMHHLIVLSNRMNTQIVQFNIHKKSLNLMEVIRNENDFSLQIKSSLDYSKVSDNPDKAIQVMDTVRLAETEIFLMFKEEKDAEYRVSDKENLYLYRDPSNGKPFYFIKDNARRQYLALEISESQFVSNGNSAKCQDPVIIQNVIRIASERGHTQAEFAVLYRTPWPDEIYKIRICAVESNNIVPKKHLDFSINGFLDIAFLNKKYLAIRKFPYANATDKRTELHYFDSKSDNGEWKQADPILHDIQFSDSHTLPMPFFAKTSEEKATITIIHDTESNNEVPGSLISESRNALWRLHQQNQSGKDHFYFPLRRGVYVCVKSEPLGTSQKATVDALHRVSPFTHFPPGLVPLIASYIPFTFDRELLDNLPVISPMKMLLPAASVPEESKLTDSSSSSSTTRLERTSCSGMFSQKGTSSSKTKPASLDKTQSRCVVM